jgi:muramoyltetrapeptide carboxypeptidase
MLSPHRVSTGTIGVFAPASPFDADRFARGIATLEKLGFRTQSHPQVTARNGFLAGSDAERLAALHDLLRAPEIDAIIAARGGYGVHRFVEHVDFDLVASAQKPIIGFSDVIALHSAVQKRASLISLHGPVVTQLGELADVDHDVFRRVLAGDWRAMTIEADGPVIASGRVTGTLVGGCLSVITPLVGSDLLFLPDDAILLLEDVSEAPYRIDRMLTHLRLAGVLRRVRGVVVGDFVGCAPPRADEQTVDQVLAERLGDLGVPVLAGFPIGHGKRNRTVPLGAKVTLDTARRVLTFE